MSHLTFLLLYSALLIGLGVWIGRGARGRDFFVADRRLGPGRLGATVLAANIGAGATMSATGLAYAEGVSAWWWNGSAGLGSLVLAFWIGPRIWRLAAAHNFYTVGDFLEFRYGPSVRGVVAALLWIGTLAILAAQLILGAQILEVVAGVPRAAGAAIGALAMMSYFVAGGLLGGTWINLLQLAVLMIGFAVSLPLVIGHAGGWHAITAFADTIPGYSDVWHAASGYSGWRLLLLLGPAFFVSPGLLQKAYGGSSARAVRIGVGVNGVVLLVFAVVPVLFGIAARASHPGLANRELALPMVLAHDLPAAVGSLALAAVFSAEVSACDAILFMLATSLSQDLYRRFYRPEATEREVLIAARWAALVGGVAGVGLAIVLPTIIDALKIFYTLLVVSLLVPLLAGLYTTRATTRDALAAIGAGVLATLATHLGAPGGTVAGLTAGNVGMIAAVAAFGISRIVPTDWTQRPPSPIN